MRLLRHRAHHTATAPATTAAAPARTVRTTRAIPVAIASALMVAVPLFSPAAPAEARPDRSPNQTSVADAVLASSPMCMSTNEDLIRLCTSLESENTSYPVRLTADPAGHHIVVLGYGLTEDGELRDELVTRLAGAKDLAEAFPETPIIVSGGAPRKGRSEADAMHEWLTDNGIDASRITKEDRSGNTKENARLSSQIVAERGGRGITLMTSRDHMERALNEFRIAAGGKWPVSGAVAL